MGYDNVELIDILKAEKIKMIDIMGTHFVFDFYSDNPRSNDILKLSSEDDQHIITKEAIFSSQEMDQAEWYIFLATRSVVETKKSDFTYNLRCPFQTSTGIRYRHKEQINPFITKKTPKWKSNYNFCSTDTGNFSLIFCSDHAKATIIEKDIRGVDFMPVLHKDLITQCENVHELIIPNILSKEALVLVGEYKENTCSSCGQIDIEFINLNINNIEVKKELIPDGIDAFRTEFTFGPGHAHREIIISKKFYNILSKELKEKHIRCLPVG